MIHRRKRPNPRSQTEVDLRAGRKNIHTEPDSLAMTDAVRHHENLNPFRPTTREHMVYDDVFKYTLEGLETCTIETLLQTVPALHRGSHISSESHTQS